MIAFGEIARPVRLLNLAIGPWIAVAPWLLAGTSGPTRWNDLLVGAAVMGLSLRRRRIENRFAGWNRYVA